MFKSQIEKAESISRQYGVLCDLLTFEQYKTVSQNTRRYEALALRAKLVSKRRSVHAAADVLLEMVNRPVMVR